MTWSDGHISVYDSSWLIARSFNDAQFKSRKLMASGPEKKLWGSEHQNDIKRHDFNDIIKDNEALYRWLHGKSKAIRRKMFGTSKFTIFQYKPCQLVFNIYFRSCGFWILYCREFTIKSRISATAYQNNCL